MTASPNRRRPARAACAALLAVSLAAARALAQPAQLPPYQSPFPIPEPRLLAESWICTGDDESHPVFAPGGRTLIFVKSTPDHVFQNLVFTRWIDGGWTLPRTLSFSGKYVDTQPFLSADGSKLYFSSNRPEQDYIGAEARDNRDLFVADRVTDTTWSDPRSLGKIVDGPVDEGSPSIAADGTLYFTSNRPGGKGGFDVWRAKLVNGAYAAPENLGDSLNTSADELEALIAPDQSWLMLAARGRKDSRGGSDLYVSYPGPRGWSAPRNLGPLVNSREDELSPHVSPDGEYFFWTSCRSFTDEPPDHALQYHELLAFIRRPRNGLGDLYQIDKKALGLRP